MATPEGATVLPPCAVRGEWQRVHISAHAELAIAHCAKRLGNVSPSECRSCHEQGNDMPEK